MLKKNVSFFFLFSYTRLLKIAGNINFKSMKIVSKTRLHLACFFDRFFMDFGSHLGPKLGGLGAILGLKIDPSGVIITDNFHVYAILDPTWRVWAQHGPTWPQFGPKMAPT